MVLKNETLRHDTYAYAHVYLFKAVLLQSRLNKCLGRVGWVVSQPYTKHKM